MSKFSRRSRWINFLFPASVQPQVTDPNTVSEDVSLVQPYDGGGYGLAAIDSPDWWTFVNGPIIADGDFVVLAIPAGFIYRFMAADFFLLAGSAPASGVNFNIQFDGLGVIAATAPQAPVGATVNAGPVFTPIVPAGADIRCQYTGGNASTRILARVYGALAPIGSVFTV